LHAVLAWSIVTNCRRLALPLVSTQSLKSSLVCFVGPLLSTSRCPCIKFLPHAARLPPDSFSDPSSIGLIPLDPEPVHFCYFTAHGWRLCRRCPFAASPLFFSRFGGLPAFLISSRVPGSSRWWPSANGAPNWSLPPPPG